MSSPFLLLFYFHLSFSSPLAALSDLHCIGSDEGIKPQEIGSLDLWSRAATGSHASKITEQTCGSYRGEINGDRTVKTTGTWADTVALCLSNFTPKTHEFVTAVRFHCETRFAGRFPFKQWKSVWCLSCLTPRDDFNIKVLQAFVELHEFADLNLVQALRWVDKPKTALNSESGRVCLVWVYPHWLEVVIWSRMSTLNLTFVTVV